ncbi:MAG: rhomboid family intramembrane serine protease [Chloroflexi bacterium]|nr:rhomboid family intramembrane serine protease [Chloroflexota bacterium]
MFPLRDLNPTRVFPLVTLGLVIANVVVFFGFQPNPANPRAAATFALEHAAIACEVTSGRTLSMREVVGGLCLPDAGGPAAFPEKRVELSVLVSMFLHGGLLHLAGNMWFLWVFGNNVEEAFGHARYALVYVLAGVVATLAFIFMHPLSIVPLVGASGAVAGVLGSYFVLYPGHWVVALLAFYVLPIPAAVFLGLWFLGQFAVADPGVAWEAHVAGFLFGAVATLLFRAPLLRRVRRLHRAGVG